MPLKRFPGAQSADNHQWQRFRIPAREWHGLVGKHSRPIIHLERWANPAAVASNALTGIVQVQQKRVVTDLNTAITPVLQAQDGSFVGTLPIGGGQINMVAFDATSSVRWVVPNEQPQVATEDGGVIGQSGITYDASGNATGQVNPFTQSWSGSMYQQGSVEQVIQNLIRWAKTLWAQKGANPSGNTTASRPWYFILNWQNQFDFIPDVPNQLLNLKTDITSNATTIKTAALQALKSAYARWPVVVVEGTPGTGDHQAVVQTSSSGTDCGDTDNNQTVSSFIYYECNMSQAQLALRVIIENAQGEASALLRQDLIRAIGRGVGNTAAHEIAHQFLAKCCSMDVLTSADPNAAATYNNEDADGDPNPQITNSDPAPYTGYGKDGKTAIHWENTTQQALQKCLAQGFKNYLPSCAVKLNLSDSHHFSPRGGVWAKANLPRERGLPLRAKNSPMQYLLFHLLHRIF